MAKGSHTHTHTHQTSKRVKRWNKITVSTFGERRQGHSRNNLLKTEFSLRLSRKTWRTQCVGFEIEYDPNIRSVDLILPFRCAMQLIVIQIQNKGERMHVCLPLMRSHRICVFVFILQMMIELHNIFGCESAISLPTAADADGKFCAAIIFGHVSSADSENPYWHTSTIDTDRRRISDRK